VSRLYRVARPLLFRLDPETAHRLVFALLRLIPVALLRRGRVADPALRTQALGLEFDNPVGLAAGFDKDAVGFRQLLALGFGFVEVGTVTPQPQPGNPRPRMFRFPADRALVNRLGFNSRGAEAARTRLEGRRERVVGVNLGRNKDSASAVDDYVTGARALGPLADYVTVNVSSPNTPGLRDLQAVEELRPLLEAVRSQTDRPVLVKIAPDLADEDVDAVADLALDVGIAGIIATNTTISREGLTETADVGAGGLSGAPLKDRALHVLERLRARAGDRLVLVAAGGIEDADDAWRRIRAGATLVQLYTGLVYGGPQTPRRIAAGLAARARADGFATVQQGVGADASAPVL
jgi:dihydroorotate dehydrogenase